MYQCGTCTDSFWDEYDCREHMDDYDHWPECETCTRTFRTMRACHQHMDNTGHWAPRFECETCNRDFSSHNAAYQHMNSLGHWAPKVPCETCGSKFHTQSQADQHMKAKGHYKNYCSSCDRRFDNENNLRMHMNSKIHRSSRISCPFCKKDYTSATGFAHHLETGSCPNARNVNRETIHRMIRERDVDGIVTNNQIGWYEEDSSEYSATNKAFNGHYWECYICHKGFNSKRGLDQHLNSPVHKQKLYHCPNRKSECGKEFVSLAALFNHLESEACAFMRFEKVQQQVGHVLGGRNRITFQ